MMNRLIVGLKQAGLRLTPQRVAICKVLAESKDHPTAMMIYHQLLPQFPTLSLATVYKTLNVLKSMGLVHAIGDAGDGAEHFDADLTPHINLVCVRCHRVVDFDEQLVQEIQHIVEQRSGYEVQGARIVYYGLCPDCRPAQRNGKESA
jgi:Fur family peroxide stress response transcriptional regulator